MTTIVAMRIVEMWDRVKKIAISRQQYCTEVFRLSKNSFIVNPFVDRATEVEHFMASTPENINCSLRGIFIKQEPHATAS